LSASAGLLVVELDFVFYTEFENDMLNDRRSYVSNVYDSIVTVISPSYNMLCRFNGVDASRVILKTQ